MKLFYEIPMGLLDNLDKRYSKREECLLDGFTRNVVKDDVHNFEVDVWRVMVENPDLDIQKDILGGTFVYDGEEYHADTMYMSYGGRSLGLYIVSPDYADDVMDILYSVFGIVYYRPNKHLLLTILPLEEAGVIEEAIRKVM